MMNSGVVSQAAYVVFLPLESVTPGHSWNTWGDTPRGGGDVAENGGKVCVGGEGAGVCPGASTPVRQEPDVACLAGLFAGGRVAGTALQRHRHPQDLVQRLGVVREQGCHQPVTGKHSRKSW